jgi:hypothetical protein
MTDNNDNCLRIGRLVNALFCWLGLHSWNGTFIDGNAGSIYVERHCSRCRKWVFWYGGG